MGTWTSTPDGGYSFTPGFLQSAPPDPATYVPAAIAPDGSGNITPAHFDYPATCQTCKKAKEDQDKLKKSQEPGTKLGTCTSLTRSVGFGSVSDLECTTTSGSSFSATSVAGGLSQPGWSGASWDVYSWPDAPAGTTMQDVVGGASYQGGLLDNTSMNSSGYMTQTGGTPNLFSFEHSNTTILTPP